MSDKAEKMEAVAFAILRADARGRRAQPKLNVSQIAKGCGVSRAWIYKYFGSTQDEIIEAVIDVLAPLILTASSHEGSTPAEWTRRLTRGLEESLDEVEQYPEIFDFYFRHRLGSSRFQNRIIFHENAYVENTVRPQLQRAFELTPARAREVAETLMTLRLGLIFRWLTTKDRAPEVRRRHLTVMKTLFKNI
jgi:AcrR family transcriptional regulator